MACISQTALGVADFANPLATPVKQRRVHCVWMNASRSRSVDDENINDAWTLVEEPTQNFDLPSVIPETCEEAVNDACD